MALTKPRILCIDDDEIIQFQIRTVLSKTHDIRQARSGTEGLDMIATGGFPWVLLDYELGDMTGGKFLAEAHKRSIRTNYVLISGEPVNELSWEGLRPLGVKGSLKKPIESHLLRNILSDRKPSGTPIHWEIMNRTAHD